MLSRNAGQPYLVTLGRLMRLSIMCLSKARLCVAATMRARVWSSWNYTSIV